MGILILLFLLVIVLPMTVAACIGAMGDDLSRRAGGCDHDRD